MKSACIPDRLEAVTGPPTTSQAHVAVTWTDANGNVCDLTGTTGSTVAHYEYNPFGSLAASQGALACANPWQFSSKYYDEETQLKYYGYRYLENGRWISRDPIGERGGLLLYGFVGNRPTDSTDSLGLKRTQIPFDENRPLWMEVFKRFYNIRAEVVGAVDECQCSRGCEGGECKEPCEWVNLFTTFRFPWYKRRSDTLVRTYETHWTGSGLRGAVDLIGFLVPTPPGTGWSNLLNIPVELKSTETYRGAWEFNSDFKVYYQIKPCDCSHEGSRRLQEEVVDYYIDEERWRLVQRINPPIAV